MRIRAKVHCALAALCLSLGATGNHAATITVTNSNDTTNVGDGCSLREALANNNNDNGAQVDCAAGAGNDAIVFDTTAFPPGVLTSIMLTGGLEIVAASNSLTTGIDGDGRVAIDGGGFTRLLVHSFGQTTLNGLALRNGRAPWGAGIYQHNGRLTVVRCTFSGNVADPGAGGGIYSENAQVLWVKQSTFSANASAFKGGGIHVSGTSTLIEDSTFAGNVSGTGASINTSAFATDMTRSLVVAGAGSGSNCSGGIGDLGGNVQAGNASDCVGAYSTLAAMNLGPLQANGSSMPTHLPGGIAIDAYACPAPSPPTDQRGLARPYGTACDAGAVELRYHALTVTAGAGGSVSATSLPAANGGGIAACTSTGGAACQARYSSETGGIPVDLAATAAVNQLFAGWEGDCAAAGDNPVATIQMNQPRSCTATFEANPVGTLSFGTLPELSAIEGDGGTRSLSIPFTLSQAAAEPVTLAYSLVPAGGSLGTVASDFTSLANGVVSFDTGVLNATLELSIVADSLVEPVEAFTLGFQLTSTREPANIEPNATLDPAVTNGLTISLGNDDSATLSLPAQTAGEGEDGMLFSWDLSAPVQGGFSLIYTTVFNTAQPSLDYVETFGTLTHGGTTGEMHDIIVPLVDDDELEPNETFGLGFDPVQCVFANCAVTVQAGTATIVDNDGGEIMFRNGFEGD